jgi:hypothetical protein
MFKKIVAVSLITTALIVPSEAVFAYDSGNSVSANVQAQTILQPEVLAGLVPNHSVQSIGIITPFSSTYRITGNGVRIRSKPSTSATIKGLLYKGDLVTGYETKTANGYEWMFVESHATGISGWVVTSYVEEWG